MNANINWLYEFSKFLDTSGYRFESPSSLELDDQAHGLKCFDKKHKGKTFYIGSWKETKAGQRFPIITVRSHKNGGITLGVFNGYDILREELDTHYQSIPKPSLHQDTQRELNEKARKAQNVQRDIEAFHKLSTLPENGQDAYLKGKQIQLNDNKSHCELENFPIRNVNHYHLETIDIRYGTDKHGNFAAILLVDAKTNEPVGVQRFYDHNIKDRETNKDFTWGMVKNGACYVIGTIDDNTKLIIFCEGFADAIILHILLGLPVVVALDASNLKWVTTAFRRKFPQIEGLVVCDNDAHKFDRMDNVGVLKGVIAAKMASYKYVVPDFTEYDQSSHPTDVWDLWQQGGDDAVKSLLDDAAEPPRGHQWHQFKLNHIGLRDTDAKKRVFRRNAQGEFVGNGKEIKKSQGPIYQAIRGLVQSAINLTPRLSFEKAKAQVFDTIKTQVIERFSHFRSTLSDDRLEIFDKRCPVPSELLTYVDIACQFAWENSLAKASQKIKGDYSGRVKKWINFDLVKIDGKWRIPAEIANKIVSADDGLHILIAPKDSGKTHSVIRPAVLRAKARGDFPVGTTPFISLSRGLSAKCAICNYLDIEKNQDVLFLYDSLAVTINSIIRPDFKEILCESKFTFADEIDQIYDAIAVGTVSKANRKPVFDLVQGVLGSSKSITTSADIDDLCLESLLLSREASEIVVYQANPAPVLSEKTVFIYDDHNVLIERLVADVLSKQPVILACDSLDLANSVKKRLEKDGVSDLKLVSKETSQSAEIQDFIANVNDPEKGVKNLVLLIYTPALQSGTSIDVPHFAKVYGVYHGQTTVDGFSQMLARDRESSELHVAFKKSGQLPQEELNKRISEAIAEKLTACQKTFELVRDEHGHIQDVKLPALELSDFDKLRIETIERQAYERDPNELLRRFIAEGASVEYVSSDEATAKKAKDKITEINKEIRAQDKAALIEAGEKITENLTEKDVAERAQKIRGHSLGARTVDEQAIVLLDTYQTSTITDEILKFHDDGKGIRRVVNLENTLSGSGDAVALDAVQLGVLPVSLMDHFRLQQKFNRLLLHSIGLEFDGDFRPVSPEKVRFSAKSPEIVDLVSKCHKHKQVFNGVMPVRVTDKSLRAPIPFVRNWLGMLGIKIVRHGKNKTPRNYELDLNTLSLLINVLRGRKQQGQNWFKDHAKNGGDTWSDDIYI